MIRRKRSDVALGPGRMLGVSGISQIDKRSNQSENSSTVTAPAYTGAVATDLILVFAGSTNASGQTLTPTSSGLTFTRTTWSDGSPQIGCWWAWQPDTTGRSILLTSGTALPRLGIHTVVLRGVDPTTPLDIAGQVQTIAASTTPTATGRTTVTDRAWMFVYLFSTDDNGLSVTTSGWTTLGAANTGVSSSHILVSKKIDTAGASSDITFNQSTNGPDASTALTIAIRAQSG